MKNRKIGEFEVAPVGLGCWAIGGEFWEGDKPLGWGKVDDNESLQAIRYALDNGINFIDTANIYGAGHSERIVGEAVKGRRDQVVLSTKFGFDANEETKQITGMFTQPQDIINMCEASLRRLNTDYIDIYYFHINDFNTDEVNLVADVLDMLIQQGKIRSYGWSTDNVRSAKALQGRDNFVSVQFESNVLNPNSEMTEMCTQFGIAGVNRGPLAMGLLSGKYDKNTVLSDSDIRKISPDWMQYFKGGQPVPALVTRINAVREILTSDGRTLTQGALAWLLANGECNIPIPGFRTVKQVSQNIATLDKKILTKRQLDEVQALLSVEVSH